MTDRASIRRAVLAGSMERNAWLASNDPAAALALQTIVRAFTGEASLQDLFDLAQAAFDAGRCAEAKATAMRLHADTCFPLTRSN